MLYLHILRGLKVVDAGDEPRTALAMFQPGDSWTGPPMAVLLNKADLLSEQQVGAGCNLCFRLLHHRGHAR